MYIVGVLAFTEDVLGDVTEIRMTLERLGHTVHLEQMGYQLGPAEIGMFEEDSLLLRLGRCYGDTERCRDIAETFVLEGVDLILAMKTPSVKAALAASPGSDIPIVFTHIADPVGEGLVGNAEKTGGRVTGIRDILETTAEERFNLLQQLVPAPTVVHAFFNPDSQASRSEAENLTTTAESMGINLRLHPTKEPEEVRRELSSMQINQNHALLRSADPLFDSLSGLMGATARENYIPYVGFHLEEIERCGALFVLDQRGIGLQAAQMVDRILRGESPAFMPVKEPERRILGVNLQAAQDLGLVVAAGVLERAQVVVHERERTTLGARLFLVLFMVAFSIVLTVAIAAQYRLQTLVIAGVVSLVFDALSLWFYLNWRIIRPIRQLTLAAEKIGVGNLDVDIGESKVEDEIGVLGRTLRRMRSNLKYSQTQLEQANASLEQQIHERTAALRKLQGIQKELELTNKRIIDADDNSRYLLTSYIHDEILVPLDGLKERARLSNDALLSELASQVEVRLRKVRYDLSVPVIQDMRVELRRLLQETLPQIYPEGRQVKLFLNLSALNHLPELEPACNVLFYHFVRGATSNVYLHAQAQKLWVKSAYDGKHLTLSVLDDGIGFNPVQVEQYIDQGHYFFHDIQIRARQLGGKLLLQSQPGEGTFLKIIIPIPALVSSVEFKNGARSGGKGNRGARH